MARVVSFENSSELLAFSVFINGGGITPLLSFIAGERQLVRGQFAVFGTLCQGVWRLLGCRPGRRSTNFGPKRVFCGIVFVSRTVFPCYMGDSLAQTIERSLSQQLSRHGRHKSTEALWDKIADLPTRTPLGVRWREVREVDGSEATPI